MSETITDLLAARADAGVMNDTTDPDPEVPERGRVSAESAPWAGMMTVLKSSLSPARGGTSSEWSIAHD